MKMYKPIRQVSMPGILAACFISFCGCSRTDGSKILMQTYNALNSHNSVAYKMTGRFKFFDQADTLRFTTNVFLERIKEDTVFGGNIWLGLNDSQIKFYDHSKIYEVNSSSKKVTTYDIAKGEEWAINGNIMTSESVWRAFLKPGKIKKWLDSGNVVILERDTVIDHISCYSISIKFPDEDGVTENVTSVYISRNDYIPVLTAGTMKYQGNTQYREFRLNSYYFDTVSKSKFSAAQIPASYTVQPFMFKEATSKPLTTGTTAPVVSGSNFRNEGKEETLDFNGKVTLLDFWYMSCMPCIKAIPEIEKLAEKYKSKPVQFFGINSKDNSENGKKRLPKFLEFNSIKYPFLLVSEDVTNAYKPDGFPTFYIIGKDGKVAFSTTGYSESLYDTLSKEIDKLLK